jgi:predicted nucleic acid-binding protein
LALPYFNPNGSKKDTFFDAVIAALAKKNNAVAIFSFDKGYKKTGIPLISDLLKI